MKITTKTNIIYVVLAALALACFALPIKARADCGDTGDVLFTVTLLHPVAKPRACLYVDQGPLGRVSSGLNVADLTAGQPCTFYAAKKTIFPVTGSWNVQIYRGDIPCALKWIPVEGNRPAQRKSLRLNDDTNRVDITLDLPRPSGDFVITVSINGVSQQKGAEGFDERAPAGGNTIEQSQASSPTKLAAEAWLGDSQDPSGRPDSDVWSFMGTAGDSVTLKVEPDTKGGNNGGQVTLRFVGPPTREVTGVLRPKQAKTISVELGSTGRYDVAIEQADGPGEERYRGGYILTIESAQGTIHSLKPGDSVEK